MKAKVLVIFPKFILNDSSHYPYWYKVFNAAKRDLDIHIIYENRISIFTRIKNIFISLRHGYRHIYIHYSYWSVFIARFFKIFFPSTTIYYWDCEFYKKKPDNKLLELALSWCDVLVTGSSSIGDQYQKIFKLKKPVKVVPNWSEYIPAQQIDLSKKQTHILFVHHLSQRKGSRELPTIILKTLKKLPNAHFHIIGGGPDLDWLKDTANVIGWSSSEVSIYGDLPLSEVRRFFASSDIFIMPSRAEGFPRVILEAMSYSLPIVSTNVGNVSEIVGNTQKEFLCLPNNIQTFPELIVKLNRLPVQIRNQIITENLKQAKTYNISQSVQSFINLF